MVVIKASKAEGSFLGRGTHVWLVIESEGKKTSFSGARAGKILRVYKDYKRDHDRDCERGEIVIPAPAKSGLSEEEWAEAVIAAGDVIMQRYDNHYAFSGIWPHGKARSGKQRANCANIINLIIAQAGGIIPKTKLKGFVPGLEME